MHIHSAGENALIAYLGAGQSPEVSAQVQQLGTAVEAALGRDLIDLVPSYASLLVIYNPMTTDHLAVHAGIREAGRGLAAAKAGDSKLVNLPVYYSSESGPDLEHLADSAGLSPEQDGPD